MKQKKIVHSLGSTSLDLGFIICEVGTRGDACDRFSSKSDVCTLLENGQHCCYSSCTPVFQPSPLNFGPQWFLRIVLLAAAMNRTKFNSQVFCLYVC